MTKITKKLFIKAVKNTNGIRKKVADNLKVDRSTVTNYLVRHPDMNIYLEEERERTLDIAEDEMLALVEFNDYDKDPASAARVRLNASQYLLSRLGKDRGYVEKQQIEHSGNATPKIIVEHVKSGDLDGASSSEG